MRLSNSVTMIACALLASPPAWPQTADTSPGSSIASEAAAHETLRRAADEVRRAQLSLDAAMGTGNPDSPAARQARAAVMDGLVRLMELMRGMPAGPQVERAVQAAEQARRVVDGSRDAADVDRALSELDQAIIDLETTLLAGTGSGTRDRVPVAAVDGAGEGAASGDLDPEELPGRELLAQTGERLGVIRHVVVRTGTDFPEAALVERPADSDGEPSLVEIPWAQMQIEPDGTVVTTLSAVAFEELPATTQGEAAQ